MYSNIEYTQTADKRNHLGPYPEGTRRESELGLFVSIDKKFWLMIAALVVVFILLAGWAMRGSG